MRSGKNCIISRHSPYLAPLLPSPQLSHSCLGAISIRECRLFSVLLKDETHSSRYLDRQRQRQRGLEEEKRAVGVGVGGSDRRLESMPGSAKFSPRPPHSASAISETLLETELKLEPGSVCVEKRSTASEHVAIATDTRLDSSLSLFSSKVHTRLFPIADNRPINNQCFVLALSKTKALD